MIEVLLFGLCENVGGIETYLIKINNNIDRTRFHFSFIDMTGENGNPAFKSEFLQNGCDFYKITPRRESVIRNIMELDKLFENHHFDVLHFSANTLSYVEPIFAALRHNCKVIVHSRSSSMTGSMMTMVLHSINKARLRNRKIKRIAVSELAETWFFGKDSDCTIYLNGIDTKRFYYSDERRHIIRESLHSEDKLVIGLVGTFSTVKNHAFAIEVFEKIKAKHSNVILWLVGIGSTMEAVQELVKEKELDNDVLFLKRRNDLPDLYCGMDAFLLPSLFEGLPNVIIEAQTSGLPCLMSDSITTMVKITDRVGYMSLAKSADDWADEILRMVDVENDRENAHKEIEDKGWSVEDEIRRIERLYISVCEGSDVE